MDKGVFKLQAEIFKALAHPMRLEIIETLGRQELCFSDILERTGGIKSTLSQHLSVMVDKGILASRKNSRCHYFRVASPKVARTCLLMRELLIEKMSRQTELLQALNA